MLVKFGRFVLVYGFPLVEGAGFPIHQLLVEGDGFPIHQLLVEGAGFSIHQLLVEGAGFPTSATSGGCWVSGYISY